MGSSRWFERHGPRAASRIDRAVSRLTGGRFTMSGLTVPTLVLTTTGARSGQPRTTALATLPEDDGSFLVVGSNAGAERHPAWTGNLLAHPRATVVHRGRTLDVDAHLLEGDARAAAWTRLVEHWPSYDTYAAKTSRQLRVFRLAPAAVSPRRPG